MREERRATGLSSHVSVTHFSVNNAEHNPDRRKSRPDRRTFLPKWQSAAGCAQSTPLGYRGPAGCLRDRSPFRTSVYDQRPRCAPLTEKCEGGAHLSVEHFFCRFQTGGTDRTKNEGRSVNDESKKKCPMQSGPRRTVFSRSPRLLWCVGTLSCTTLAQITKEGRACRQLLRCYRIISYVNTERYAPRCGNPRGGALRNMAGSIASHFLSGF